MTTVEVVELAREGVKAKHKNATLSKKTYIRMPSF